MVKKRAFISFDYDHDEELKIALIGQSKNPDSPFEIVDMSIKEAIDSNWKIHARKRIKSCDVVIVICGHHTDTAKGVSAEISIAKEEKIPYFLLSGRVKGNVVKPKGSLSSDKIYKWTWENLQLLLKGYR
ncbi:MAG TPA: hypothetical protein GX747_03385 [Tenericutes bacterium]|jgi:hypothetical protein|nr:hypothetical protein [Mycoplasmatota bacterium]